MRIDIVTPQYPCVYVHFGMSIPSHNHRTTIAYSVLFYGVSHTDHGTTKNLPSAYCLKFGEMRYEKKTETKLTDDEWSSRSFPKKLGLVALQLEPYDLITHFDHLFSIGPGLPGYDKARQGQERASEGGGIKRGNA